MIKKVRKTFLLPPDLLEKAIKYKEANFYSNLTEAIIRLIVKGLESEGDKK